MDGDQFQTSGIKILILSYPFTGLRIGEDWSAAIVRKTGKKKTIYEYTQHDPA